MTISYALYNSFRLRQFTGIPLTRICEVACEIAYEALLRDPELLERTREKYAVRTPERQLEIDLSRGWIPSPLNQTRKKYGVRTPWRQLAIDTKRGYKRVIPLEYFGDFEDDGSESTIPFQAIFPNEEGV